MYFPSMTTETDGIDHVPQQARSSLEVSRSYTVVQRVRLRSLAQSLALKARGTITA